MLIETNRAGAPFPHCCLLRGARCGPGAPAPPQRLVRLLCLSGLIAFQYKHTFKLTNKRPAFSDCRPRLISRLPLANYLSKCSCPRLLRSGFLVLRGSLPLGCAASADRPAVPHPLLLTSVSFYFFVTPPRARPPQSRRGDEGTEVVGKAASIATQRYEITTRPGQGQGQRRQERDNEEKQQPEAERKPEKPFCRMPKTARRFFYTL